MANIAGKYFTRLIIPDTEYTFTNDAAARNANFSPSTTGDEIVNLYATNSDALNAPVLLPVQNRFNINRVRLVSSGAPGLQPGNASPFLAGKITLGVGIEDPDNPGAVLVLDNIHITITRWDAWEDCKKALTPFRNMADINLSGYISVKFFVLKNDCSFWCDDYNLQSEYTGEKTKPILEMEVDTAGLLDTLNHVLF
jgi:hypothetical protein